MGGTDGTPGSSSLASFRRFLNEKLHSAAVIADLPPPSLVPILAGTVAFSSALAASTFAQLRLLRVSTGSVPPVPTLLGVGSVGAASALSQWAAVRTYDYCRRSRWVGEEAADGSVGRMRSRPSESSHTSVLGFNAHTLRVCAVGAVAFKLLGGRFWSISPSSYTHVGSFARASLPATMKYGTATERAAIERLGRTFGCHTCGTRMLLSRLPRTGSGSSGSGSSVVRFHADHVPPRAVAEQMNRRWYRRILGRTVPQRFYPQCVDCSNVQGGMLSSASNELRRYAAASRRWKLLPRIAGPMGGGGAPPSLKGAGGGGAAHFHGFRPRLHHAAGGVVAAATVCEADEEDVLDGNRERFERLQDFLEEMGLDVWYCIRNRLGGD